MNYIKLPTVTDLAVRQIDLGFGTITQVDHDTISCIEDLKRIVIGIIDDASGMMVSAAFSIAIDKNMIKFYDRNFVIKHISQSAVKILIAAAKSHTKGAFIANEDDYSPDVAAVENQYANYGSSSVMYQRLDRYLSDYEPNKAHGACRTGSIRLKDSGVLSAAFIDDNNIEYQLRRVQSIEHRFVTTTFLNRILEVSIANARFGHIYGNALIGLALVIGEEKLNDEFVEAIRHGGSGLISELTAPSLDFDSVEREKECNEKYLQAFWEHMERGIISVTKVIRSVIPPKFPQIPFPLPNSSSKATPLRHDLGEGRIGTLYPNGLPAVTDQDTRELGAPQKPNGFTAGGIPTFVGRRLTDEHGGRGTAVPVWPDAPPAKTSRKKPTPRVTVPREAPPAKVQPLAKAAVTSKRVAGLSDFSNDRIAGAPKKIAPAGSLMEKVIKTNAPRTTASKKPKTTK